MTRCMKCQVDYLKDRKMEVQQLPENLEAPLKPPDRSINKELNRTTSATQDNRTIAQRLGSALRYYVIGSFFFGLTLTLFVCLALYHTILRFPDVLTWERLPSFYMLFLYALSFLLYFVAGETFYKQHPAATASEGQLFLVFGAFCMMVILSSLALPYVLAYLEVAVYWLANFICRYYERMIVWWLTP
jgi:hypothetical protein